MQDHTTVATLLHETSVHEANEQRDARSPKKRTTKTTFVACVVGGPVVGFDEPRTETVGPESHTDGQGSP